MVHTDRLANGSRHEIVVGVNGSPAAAEAIRWAAEQSRISGTPLRMVHAWQMPAGQVLAADSGFWEASVADTRARATRWVLDALGGTAAAVPWVLDIVEGPPGPVLVSRSQEAALLVLGTREHVGMRRVLVGSVSHHCLTHAHAPVVAIPVPELEPEEAGPSGAFTTPGPLL